MTRRVRGLRKRLDRRPGLRVRAAFHSRRKSIEEGLARPRRSGTWETAPPKVMAAAGSTTKETRDVTPLADRVPPGGTHDPDEILGLFLDWVAETGLTLYPAQEEALL